MSGRSLKASGYSQLRPVLLLLAIAVVVPTLCLLWFMTQAVKNERLAIRQKLVSVYENKLTEAVQKANDVWLQNQKFLDSRRAGAHPYQTLLSVVSDNGYDGLIIYDATGKRTYPLLSTDIDKQIELDEEFSEAWQLEFDEQKFYRAAELYEQKAYSGSNYVRLASIVGKSRCLAKLGRLDEAIDKCKRAAFSSLENQADANVLVLIGNARLLLMKFSEQDTKYTSLFEETFEKLLSMIYATNKAGVALPADHNLFLAQKILKILTEAPSLEDDTSNISTPIQKLIAAEEHSIGVAEYFPTAADFDNWQTNQLRRFRVGKEFVYGLYHKTSTETLLLLLSQENIALTLSDYENTFKGSDAAYRILDDSGHLITGLAQPKGEPFITAHLGEYFPGWKTELYFEDGNIFEKAASKQIALYTWAGVLVIVLILVAGGWAGQVIGKQIKLNRLKNDFIATVSHELKTPLASIRILVDTLLEGNYKDQEQVAEYLQLTSKENERLSRLIDNFLTFSRMERNKQVFEVVKTSPVAIASRAVEAVKTRFINKDRCEFDISIDENLPDVLADSDAMVTVLINLLENAYKYSCDEKRIVFKVFTENNQVYFQVVDNGIGMSRWSAKRIFDRFYQTNPSLSRSAEGCGLGLSIVKFIVDAHKGSVSVKSKPGKGSVFTVKLSVAT